MWNILKRVAASKWLTVSLLIFMVTHLSVGIWVDDQSTSAKTADSIWLAVGVGWLVMQYRLIKEQDALLRMMWNNELGG